MIFCPSVKNRLVAIVIIQATERKSRHVFNPYQHMFNWKPCVPHHHHHHHAKVAALRAAHIIAAMFGCSVLSEVRKRRNEDFVQFVTVDGIVFDVFFYAPSLFVPCAIIYHFVF